MLDKIVILANKCRNDNNLKLAEVLTKVAIDVALQEQLTQLKIAQSKAKQVSHKLNDLMLYNHATQVDRLAQDLENKIGEFEVEDPIEAVLKSYSLIHKIAETHTNHPNEAIDNILTFVEIATEADELSDSQILDEVRKRSLGLSQQDKNYINYIIDKEFNLSFEDKAQKLAQSTKINQEKPEKNEDKLNNLTKKVKQVKEDIKQQQDKDKQHHKWYNTFPTTPPIWGGFAYQAIVPYQQSSQINFWTLAELEKEDMFNKLGFSKE